MKSECILKARQDAHAEGPASSATTTMACQEINTRGQNCNPCCTETSTESCGRIDNSSSCHGNDLGLIDNQIPMATDEFQILELNETEQDLKNLNDNRQDPLRLLRNERDLKENGWDLLQDVLDACLESEKKETPCDDSWDPPKSNNELTQSNNRGDKTEQSGTEAEGPFPRLTFFAPPVSAEYPGRCQPSDADPSTTFTTAPQGSHPEPDPQCSTGAQTSGTKTREEDDYEDIHNSRFISSCLRWNRWRKTAETEEELDVQITKALARVDLRFNQFMTQNRNQGSGVPDSTKGSQGRSSETGPPCETGDVGSDSVNSGLTRDTEEPMERNPRVPHPTF